MISLANLPWPGLIEALGLALLHFLWQGLAIAVVLKIALHSLRNAPAATRYWISVAALAAMALALPLTTLYLLEPATQATGAAVIMAPLTLAPAGSGTSGGAGMWGFAPYLVVGLWLAGVLVISLRLLLGWRGLLRLKRSAQPESTGMIEAISADMHRLLGLSRAVQVALSEAVRSPMLIGWLRPIILLPPAIVATLPREHIEMIIAHELTHFRRRDHWVNLFQVIIETLLFYHPAVAWVSRRIRVERENACDDLAIASTGRRVSYVEMLATLERNRLPGPALALGVQDGQIVERIRRLVERGEPRSQRGSVLPLLLLSGALAAGVAVPLIDSRSDEPPAVENDTPGPAQRPATEARENALPRALENRPEIELAAPDVAPPAATAPAESSLADAADNAPETPVAIEPLRLDAPDPGQLLAARDPITMPLSEPALASGLPPLPVPVAGNARDAALEVVAGGNLIERVDPHYPRTAMRREISGAVALELLVNDSGRVEQIEVIRETPSNVGFAESAISAAREWVFDPFTRDGEPIDHRVRIEFEFDPGTGCHKLTGSRIPRC